jgi:hypothetical protein
MDVKQAVRAAKDYVSDILSEEGLTNLGLEEVQFNDNDNTWEVTLGFSRPWNSVQNALTKLTGDETPRRVYRVIRVQDRDGRILSFRKRENLD